MWPGQRKSTLTLSPEKSRGLSCGVNVEAIVCIYRGSSTIRSQLFPHVLSVLGVAQHDGVSHIWSSSSSSSSLFHRHCSVWFLF